MNRRRRRHESTAYHESGHAVAAFVLSLKIGRRGVTIVPDADFDVKALKLKSFTVSLSFPWG